MKLITKALNAIAACTGVVVVSDILPKARDPHRETVLDLPGRRQVEDFSCGFVAGLMVTDYFGGRVSVDRLYGLVRPDPTWGASTRKLATALRECGIRVALRDRLDFAAVAEAIAAGRPVITCVASALADDNHWAVIYGVGIQPRRVFLAGVGVPHVDFGKVLRWGEFRRMWTPPGNGLICSRATRRRR